MYNIIKTVQDYIVKKKEEEARYYQGALDALALLTNELKKLSEVEPADDRRVEKNKDIQPKRGKKKGE